MKCDSCDNVTFETFGAGSKHYRDVHDKKFVLMCCGRHFDNRESALRHVGTHKKLQKSDLTIDEQNDLFRQYFTMKCDICSNVQYDTFLQAKHHYRAVHKRRG